MFTVPHLKRAAIDFADGEAEHLINCRDCYRQWKLYVDDFARDRPKQAPEDV